MTHKPLKNKPLVEAHVEIEWALQEHGPQGIKTDPYYKMALGRFYERVMGSIPSTRPWLRPSFPRRWSTTRRSICFEWGGDGGRQFRWGRAFFPFMSATSMNGTISPDAQRMHCANSSIPIPRGLTSESRRCGCSTRTRSISISRVKMRLSF